MKNSQFEFKRAEYPETEDDSWELKADPRIHIQVLAFPITRRERYFVGLFDGKTLYHHGYYATLGAAMVGALQLRGKK